MNPLRIIVLIVLAVFGWTLAPAMAGQAVPDPASDAMPQPADEAFATYVNWAAEDLGAAEGFRLTLGRANVPLGHASLSASDDLLKALESMTPGDSAFDSADDENLSTIGINLSLPAGFSTGLYYGAADRTNSPTLFEGLGRDLSLHIDRSARAHAYGTNFRWQTPLSGFTLKGGLSQLNLSANGATLLTTGRWPLTAVDRQSQGRMFNTTRTWRAGAEQTIGNLKLSAEYVQNQMDTRFSNNLRVEQVGEGYTGRAAYQVTDWFRVGSSYSLYFADRDDRRGESLEAMGLDPAGAWIRDIGISARFDLSNRMALHLEGHLMNGLFGVAEGTDEDWRRFGARMTINF